MDLAVPTHGTSGSGSPLSCRVSLLGWGWLVCASSWPSGALLSDRPWVETAVSRGGLLESRTLSFLPSSGSGQSARRAHPKEKEPECGHSLAQLPAFRDMELSVVRRSGWTQVEATCLPSLGCGGDPCSFYMTPAVTCGRNLERERELLRQACYGGQWGVRVGTGGDLYTFVCVCAGELSQRPWPS